MIPGLENAEFVRYGVMHRNTFIDSPRLLRHSMNMIKNERLFFAGQITGVEGYIESAASGIWAALNAKNMILNGDTLNTLPNTTMLGALVSYITDSTVEDFQPMGSNMGILPSLNEHIKSKQDRYAALSQRGLTDLDSYINENIK
jgi:methylenetetrahydrofolate--tRNA-(uracil-5-)-methyltransferase